MINPDIRTKFTFHNVSINSLFIWLIPIYVQNLHSTMFLLIPNAYLSISGYVPVFTFHNVSINSVFYMLDKWGNQNLHSTMFLLILGAE